MAKTAMDRIDLPPDKSPRRWQNPLPDLPRPLDDLLEPSSGKPVSQEFMGRLLSQIVLAQESSAERWIEIPERVRSAYRVWRPTPVFRARALEEHLGTSAEIYFKYEGGSPTGSHKLNSAVPQAYYASLEGIRRLVTDTGAGQWGCALALASQMFDIESLVYMVRSSYRQKPYRRLLMEAHGAEVFASPSQRTDFGRTLLAQEPDHPGSEGIAVSEAITTVLESSDSRLGMGGFGNHVLLHQTVIGLETRLQLEQIDREPNYLIASCGCGSNLGGLIIPWLPERLSGGRVRFVAAESTACPSLTLGEYKYDPSDASGLGPLARTFTLGHDFVPPAIGAGGLRYHGVAPLIGLLKAEGLLQVSAYTPAEIAHAGRLFLQLHGLVPAPETAHAIRAVIDATRETSEDARPAIIVMCFSGDGLLDLDSYDVGVPEDVDSRTSSLAGKY